MQEDLNDGSRQSLVVIQQKIAISVGAGRVKMNWGHWWPGASLPLVWEWEGVDMGGGVGLGGNTEGVKQDFAPHEFVCLGPGLEGFTSVPCVYKNQIYNISLVFVTYERYKPNYFENWCITLSLAIKCLEQRIGCVCPQEPEWPRVRLGVCLEA